jgi:hypothetical protein
MKQRAKNYAPLWREQLGEVWGKAGTVFTRPVLSGDDARRGRGAN